MKYYGGYSPTIYHQEPPTPPEPTITVGDDIAQRLQQKSQRDVKRPDAYTLIDEVPDVVAWLRSQMTARPLPGDDDRGMGSGKPGSKPPFRVAYADAADRELSALCYWAADYGIHPRAAWLKGDLVRGMLTAHTDAAADVSLELKRILHRVSLPDDILTHPKFGLWTVRSNHYSVWPQLAAIFEPVSAPEVDEPEDVEEGLF